jgi:hypothetical protein
MKIRARMLLAASLLAGCVETGPSVSVSTATSAKAAMADLFVQVSVADFLARNCAEQGIRAAYRSEAQAIDIGQSQLAKAGFDPAELAQARAVELTASPDVLAERALSYLLDRGAKQGDIGSFCAAGLQEMAKRSFVGTLLRPA